MTAFQKQKRPLAALATLAMAIACFLRIPAGMFPTGDARLLISVALIILAACVYFSEQLNQARYSDHIGYALKAFACIQVFAFAAGWGFQALYAVFMPSKWWVLVLLYPLWLVVEPTNRKEGPFNERQLNSWITIPTMAVAFAAGLATFASLNSVLSDAIVNNQITDLGVVTQAFGTQFGETTIMLVFVAALLAAFGGLFYGAYALHRKLRAEPASTSPLTARQMAVQDIAIEKVFAELSESKSGQTITVIIVVLAMIISAGAGIAAGVFMDVIARNVLETSRTSGLDWFVYQDSEGISVIFMVLAGIMFSISIFFALIGLNKYAMMSGWTGSQAEQNRPFLTMTITSMIRSGDISDPHQITARDVVYRTHFSMVRMMAIFGGILLAVGLFFQIPDRAQYSLITRDSVHYSNWFTFQTTEISLSDVRYIRIECRLAGDDDTLSVDYALGQTPNSGAKLISGLKRPSATTHPTLDEWEALHTRLVSSGAKISHPSVGFPSRPGFDADQCRDGIERDYGPALEPRLKNLLLGEDGL